MTDAGGAAVVVRRPLSPRKFFAMLYETDTAEVRRPLADAAPVRQPESRSYGPSATAFVPATIAANAFRQTVVVVRPTAAYVERTFAAGLTAFREYTFVYVRPIFSNSLPRSKRTVR